MVAPHGNGADHAHRRTDDLEACGFRLLTGPTFDPPGQYHPPHTTLSKTARPALAPEAVGPIDAVLLSHDQHADNLDNSGLAFLPRAGRVLTTLAGAQRLGILWKACCRGRPSSSERPMGRN
jgi:L-ascorbate metabolism protein UlaG (beta-lactamase superfamily)